MFGKKKQPPIKSLIAQGSCIEGNLKFTDGLRIDGEVIGDIRAADGGASILVISESASVTGHIYADHVIINGRVIVDHRCHGPVALHQHGHVALRHHGRLGIFIWPAGRPYCNQSSSTDALDWLCALCKQADCIKGGSNLCLGQRAFRH